MYKIHTIPDTGGGRRVGVKLRGSRWNLKLPWSSCDSWYARKPGYQMNCSVFLSYPISFCTSRWIGVTHTLGLLRQETVFKQRPVHVQTHQVVVPHHQLGRVEGRVKIVAVPVHILRHGPGATSCLTSRRCRWWCRTPPPAAGAYCCASPGRSSAWAHGSSPGS